MAQPSKGGKGSQARLFASDYIRGTMARDAGYGEAVALNEQLGVLGAARNRLGARSSGVIVASDGKNYQAFAKKGQDYEAMRQETLSRANGKGDNARFIDANAFDAAVAASYGEERLTPDLADRFVADAYSAHAAAEGPRLWAEKGAGNALRNVGTDLLADKPEVAAQALQAMNITADKLAAKYGAAAAESFKTEIQSQVADGNLKGALEQLGLTEDQLSGVIKPEADNWWTASQSELKDIPVLGGLPRWGLAALGGGTTAATAGLAYHLMAQGQQQSDPVAYASAVQAMNAY
jgi:hypothetical protein